MARGHGPRRVDDLLAERRDPCVAREREEEQARRREDGVGPGRPRWMQRPQTRGGGRPSRERRENAGRERRQDQRDDQLREPRGLADPEAVDDGQRHDGGYGQRARARGRQVVSERQRHGGRARDLADHEPPAGQETPDIAEAPPPVDVGASGIGVERGERRRGDGVAVGEGAGDEQPDQHQVARGPRRRPDRREHAGAHHRAEADEDRVARPQPAGQARRGRGVGRGWDRTHRSESVARRRRRA